MNPVYNYNYVHNYSMNLFNEISVLVKLSILCHNNYKSNYEKTSLHKINVICYFFFMHLNILIYFKYSCYR